MAVIASEMLPLGTMAPDFNLPDTAGNTVSLQWPPKSKLVPLCLR